MVSALPHNVHPAGLAAADARPTKTRCNSRTLNDCNVAKECMMLIVLHPHACTSVSHERSYFPIYKLLLFIVAAAAATAAITAANTAATAKGNKAQKSE